MSEFTEPPATTMKDFMSESKCPAWLRNFLTRGASLWTDIDWSHGSTEPIAGEPDDGRQATDQLAGAQAIGSKLVRAPDVSFQALHHVILDIDVPHMAIPSSTEGHAHLIFNRAVTWENYLNLLDALVKCEIVQQGYVDMARLRGEAFLRLPWVRKGTESEDATLASIEEHNGISSLDDALSFLGDP